MLKSKKHVFWEALIVTIVIFLAGFLIGMIIETRNSTEVSDLYIHSEISLTDASTTMKYFQEKNSGCEQVINTNIKLADQIYEEAKLLEKYEETQTLTKNMDLLHKKYDLLRTLLWMNNGKTLESCKNYNLVVYLYEYETDVIEQQATQSVWSKILRDLKESNDNILLIPIAADQNLSSLDLMIEENEIQRLPAVIVNNEHVFYELENEDSIQEILR